MKKTKVIIPALGLLVLSTAASVSGTVAWFSVNSTVSATGMVVQAKAEAGLLISADKSTNSWDDSDASKYSTAVGLVPTSTSTLGTWYHAVSTSASNYAASSIGYSVLDTAAGNGKIQVTTQNLASATTNAVANITYAESGKTADYQASEDTGYYLMTKFYIKSSGDAISVDATNNWLAINNITLGGITASQDLDASLRVGVKIGEAVRIIAPFAAASGRSENTSAETITYNVNTSSSTTAYKGTLAANGSYNPDLNTGWTGTIPAKTATSPDSLEVDIYLWYEGEDGNCMSDNVIATLDTLQVSVGFELATTAPTNKHKA